VKVVLKPGSGLDQWEESDRENRLIRS
jgi:hypothetical protein